MKDLPELSGELRRFAEERDWGQFHSPKNLATALAVEAAELLEHFQWMPDDDSWVLPEDRLGAISEEVADVQIFLTMFADALGIDILEAARNKIARNRERYPVERARGSSAKAPHLSS